MSVESVLARIAELEQTLGPRAASTTGGAQFATALAQATASPSPVATAAAVPASFAPSLTPLGMGGGSPGQRALAAAQAEVGQAEQPPGSNDSPRIAQYRQATAGSGVGPWCGYFVSWAAQQAGTPLGEQGQGLGSVAAVADWASRTGRLQPPGSIPQPGDLIVWGGRHIGIVESVDPSGAIHTIEGNSSDQVSRRSYGPDGGGATGYVRL